MMQVTKIWWDGEKLMAEPIDPASIYKDQVDDINVVDIPSLYKKPEQPREWVRLTEEEIDRLRHLIDWTAGWSYAKFARAIEALCKEKNA
jgi:hypothetical protein